MKDILTITNLYMGVLFMVIMLLLFIITLIVSVRKKIKYDINYKEYTKNSGITLEECESLLDEFITREFDNYCILNLNYQDINFTFSRLIYLNAPTTTIKKVLFEQGNNTDIYLESYHISSYGQTYHGLKVSSNIYLSDNSYIINRVEGYELTSYKLNSIKYRVSSNPTGLGEDIISWNTVNSYPVLNIGKDNDICIENNKITIKKINCAIEIDNNYNHIIIYNSNNRIIINQDNIKFKLGNLFITMTSDGISDGTNTKTWTQLLS